MINWDQYFIGMAEYISKRSKDRSTKVGAVIVDQKNRLISIGYNGLPQAIKDSEEILLDRELKYKTIIHGEINALIFAKQSIEGCTLYTIPFLPCSNCASIFIQAGIKRVVAPKNTIERWESSLALSKKLFDEAGVEYLEL